MVQKSGPGKPATRRGLAPKAAKSTTTKKAAQTGGGGGSGSSNSSSKARKGGAEEERGEASAAERKQQQALLDVFGDAFAPVLRDDADDDGASSFAAGLQRVKQALYARDFAAAFGRADHLDVYAARWSPTRALGYARVLAGLGPHLAGLVAATPRTTPWTSPPPPPSSSAGAEGAGEAEGAGQAAGGPGETSLSPPPPPLGPPRLRVLAIGGGAAEIVALAAFLQEPTTTTTTTETKKEKGEEGEEGDGGKGEETGVEAAPGSWVGDLTLLDAGPWGAVVDKLYGRLTRPRPLSAYASAAARAANRALVEPARFRARFLQGDVLELGPARLGALLGGGGDGGGGEEEEEPPRSPPAPLLVTLLFTLNELYTAAGLGKTTGFLRSLARGVAVGSLLLVVDSPGSYSEAAVGKDAQKYPMQWLLDQTLLTPERLPEGACHWEKLESDESVWFRVAEGLRYPIPLENMRYQMHLYRAISPVAAHDD